MGALGGLRVLDLTDETGRLAGKLLAEAGADVLRLRRGAPGRPIEPADPSSGGILDWWFDVGVRRCELDLAAPAARDALLALAARADLLIETTAPGALARIDADYAALSAQNPRLVQVSLTPFGRTGPRADWQVSDLVAGALGGPISVSGTPEQPLNTFGRQWFNVGGFYAAICGLAAVHDARARGRGQHIDLSLHQAVISCTEQLLMYWSFPGWFAGSEGIAPRQGSLHWSRIYQVMPCRVGHALMTPSPKPLALRDWIVEDGCGHLLPDPFPNGFVEIVLRSGEVMGSLRQWAATKSASEIFAEARERHLALAEVMTLGRAAASDQPRARGFFRAVEERPEVRLPGPLFRTLGCPAATPTPPPRGGLSTQEVLAAWPLRDGATNAVPQPNSVAPASDVPAPSTGLLHGVRVLDFTWVLAGPFGTRVLGDLGADIVKLQTEERAQGANANEFPFFVMWNRSKRSVGLNMKHERAIDVFRRLVECSDVVVDNFSPGVLERWGIGYEVARSWNPRIIYLAMSGCGRDGPWRNLVTYAPSIHALCGLTHLTNPAGGGELGSGVSLSDHVSGLAGALAVLEALEHRRRTGEGQMIDLSQLEVGAYLLGPAYVELLATGYEAQPEGNRDAYEDLVPNELYRCSDGHWLAITARSDDEWQRLCLALGDTELAGDAALGTAAGRRAQIERIDRRLTAWTVAQRANEAEALLQSRGIPAGIVQNARDLAEDDPQLRARDWLVGVEHATLGAQQVDRFPGTFGSASLEPYRAAPSLGLHTFEVYAELLGMSVEEIAAAVGEGLLV